MELPAGLNPQQVGSAVTYFRRYTLSSILCLQSVDDDANLASVPVKAAKPAITTLLFTRDLELEEEIKVRLHHCTEYYVKYINQLNNKSFVPVMLL